jgi:hypothetical protein
LGEKRDALTRATKALATEHYCTRALRYFGKCNPIATFALISSYQIITYKILYTG